jgi:hypothetical protein
MKKSEKPKIKITGTAKATPVPPKKTFKPGSMVTSSKNVTVKPAAAKKKSPSLAAKAAGAVGKVASRVKTTAREARDIPTAVGTVVRAAADGKKGFRKEYAVAELKKQVKETTRAAKTGLKGSAAPQYGKGRGNR